MTRLILFSLASALLFLPTHAAEVPLPDPDGKPGDATKPIVVMLGDSTTDRGMPTFVKKQLDQLIKSPIQRPTVINAGKGGDNATSALDRLEKDVLAHHPDIVTVSFGLNDTGGRKPDQFKESLQKIIKILKAADIPKDQAKLGT